MRSSLPLRFYEGMAPFFIWASISSSHGDGFEVVLFVHQEDGDVDVICILMALGSAMAPDLLTRFSGCVE